MATYADRVKETSTTTGTGTYSLAGAVSGFRTFVDGVGTGQTVCYCATDGTDWEVGEGVITDATPDTLTRASILASSNAGSAVSWAAGTRDIFLTYPAARLVSTDKTNTFTAAQVIPAGSVGSPSLTFTSDTNTGIYSSAADTVDISVGGVRGLQVGTTASAVNYIQILPWTAGGSPDIKALGSDTNIGMWLIPKGTTADSAVYISNSNTSYFKFNGWNDSTETYYTSTSATNTNYIITKGTSTAAQHVLQAWDGTNYRNLFVAQPAATITGVQNYVSVYSQNASSHPSVEAEGGDTNINLDLYGKGTGSIRLNSTTTTVDSTGKLTTTATASGQAGFNLPHGTAPSSPSNGDFWTTSAGGVFARINGTTQNLAPRASPTFTGTVNTAALTASGLITGTAGATITGATTSSVRGFSAAEYNAGNSSTSLTVNFNNGANQLITMTGNCTFTFSNPVAGSMYKLRLVQGSSGSYTVTWPTIKWAGAAAPTLSTVVGREDIITLYYNGTAYYGQASIDFR